jgi:hypothetical protein
MDVRTQNIKSFFFRNWWLYYFLFFIFLGIFIYTLTQINNIYANNRIDELNRRFDDCYQRRLENDSIRVVNNAGQFGCLSFTLLWNSIDDLDLDIIDAENNHIWYKQYCKREDGKFSSTGGQLDIDLNAEGVDTEYPVENVYFKCTPPNGIYSARVRAFEKRDPNPIKIKLIVRKKGKIIKEITSVVKQQLEIIELIKYNYNSNE